MAERDFELFDSALVGHVVSIELLCKLVEKVLFRPMRRASY